MPADYEDSSGLMSRATKATPVSTPTYSPGHPSIQLHLEEQGDLASRLVRGITGVTIWLIGVINLPTTIWLIGVINLPTTIWLIGVINLPTKSP